MVNPRPHANLDATVSVICRLKNVSFKVAGSFEIEEMISNIKKILHESKQVLWIGWNDTTVNMTKIENNLPIIWLLINHLTTMQNTYHYKPAPTGCVLTPLLFHTFLHGYCKEFRLLGLNFSFYESINDIYSTNWIW